MRRRIRGDHVGIASRSEALAPGTSRAQAGHRPGACCYPRRHDVRIEQAARGRGWPRSRRSSARRVCGPGGPDRPGSRRALAADPDARARFLLAHAAEGSPRLAPRAGRAGRPARRGASPGPWEGRSRGDGERAGRQSLALGQVYQAPYTGYVALFFTGGRTDRVELRVGSTPPPDVVVCSLNVRNDVNSYAGCVVRRGEPLASATSDTGPASRACAACTRRSSRGVEACCHKRRAPRVEPHGRSPRRSPS